jgi:signal transduction histidine kinase
VAERRPSLQAAVVLIVVAVAALPVPYVALIGALGDSRDERVRRAVADAAAEVAEAVRAGHVEGVEGPARRHHLRVRVVDARGALLGDADHDERGAPSLGVPSLGTAAAPRVDELEARRGPLGTRPEVREACEHGAARSTGLHFGGQLLVSEALVRVDAPQGAVVVHAQKSAARSVQRLADVERPLLTLVAFVLASGLLLALWLVRRIVGPLARLRAAVRARAAEPRLAASPIVLPAPPEIADVVLAFNTLLEALATQRRDSERSLEGLAHELKTPLAALRAAVELQPDERLAASVTASIRRIDGTVGQLLELARAEAGLPAEPRERVDAGALARGVVASFVDEGCAPGVRVAVEAEEAFVQAAPLALGGALHNLLDNAASFARGEVAVRVAAEGGAVVIEVRDDGPGIAAEDLPRIFDRFFTRRAGRGGTGLGLSLVRAVAEAHGGRAEAASVAGQGARLWMTLPGG